MYNFLFARKYFMNDSFFQLQEFHNTQICSDLDINQQLSLIYYSYPKMKAYDCNYNCTV
jgi:hypothetical protein